jgi:membrane-bound serine protease (ClpP class)
LPGIVGIAALALYFLGGYVAGLAGAGWAVLFVLGLILVALEWFVFPGTLVAGLTGAALMLIAIVMGMVDVYPGAPTLPTFPQLQLPLRDISLAVLVSLGLVLVLARFLPQTTLFRNLVSQTASGVISVAALEQQQQARLGQTGVTVSQLYPGGKARFGDQLLDVLTRGELVEKGRTVRIIAHSGLDAVVEEVG